MSMNNYIHIEEVTPDKFRVMSVDADVGGGFLVQDGLFTLRKAIMLGQGAPNEYGLQFTLLTSKQRKEKDESFEQAED